MGLDIRLEPPGRTCQAVLFGRPHGDELPPPCQQGAEFVGLGVRQGPRGRTHRLGNMGQGPRVEGIRFGQLPGGFGKVADLAGIHHRDGEPRCGQRRDHGSLVASCGFKHDERGPHGLQSRHQGGYLRVIVGHRPAFACGPQGNIELGFGNINTNKALWDRHHHS
jgi:hypothetical protein